MTLDDVFEAVWALYLLGSPTPPCSARVAHRLGLPIEQVAPALRALSKGPRIARITASSHSPSMHGRLGTYRAVWHPMSKGSFRRPGQRLMGDPPTRAAET